MRADDGIDLEVCVAGTLDESFHRNRILLSLLEDVARKVRRRTVKLWGARDAELVRDGKLRLALRAAWVLPVATWRFLRAPRPDLLFVGYPGHLDMPWLGLVARLRGVPVVFDMFISLYDTVALDRRLVPATSWTARLLAAIDRLACRSADMVLTDTPPDAEFLSALSGVPSSRIRVQWVGAEESLFHPRPVEAESRRVLFYGTYIPLHGIDTIVRAAKLLEGDGVSIRLIGSGQERRSVEGLVCDLGVVNVELLDPVPLGSLPHEIASAAVCLGIFGTTSKASRVVPNKVFQAVAMARPVVTADSSAIRAAFEPGEIVTVPPGDPIALAAAIRELLEDPERANRVAEAGYRRYLRDYSRSALSRLLAGHLAEAAGWRGRKRG